MNKIQRFFGRISAEICLKMDYFGSKSQKSPSAGGFAPRPLFRLMTRECARPTPIEHFWLRQMIGNRMGKTKLIFYIFCPLLSKKLSRAVFR